MARIIAPSRHVTTVEWRRSFEWIDCPGAGFSFNCDENGNITKPLNDDGTINNCAVESMIECFTNDKIVDDGYADWGHTYHEGPQVECDCGNTVYCNSGFANDCERCGREYNGSGQQLAPRSQWGGEFVTQPEEDYGLYSFADTIDHD